MIRSDTDYALRMLANLAARFPARVSAAELSEKLGVPHGFAQKILRKLSAAGILEGRPGRTGGFHLAKPPKEVSLLDVIAAMQGPPLLNRCTKGPGECEREAACRISHQLRMFQDKLNAFFSSARLSDIAGVG